MTTPTPVPAHSQNTLSRDVEIKGTVTYEGSLFSDATIEGDILTAGTLSVGAHGSVLGDVSAGTVSIQGKIEGNVSVEDRCELRGGAQLIGDLDAPRLTMEEGTTFIGTSRVGPRSKESTPRAI